MGALLGMVMSPIICCSGLFGCGWECSCSMAVIIFMLQASLLAWAMDWVETVPVKQLMEAYLVVTPIGRT